MGVCLKSLRPLAQLLPGCKSVCTLTLEWMLHKVQNWGSISQIESALIECLGRFSLFQAQFVRESQLQLPPALLLISLSLLVYASLFLSPPTQSNYCKLCPANWRRRMMMMMMMTELCFHRASKIRSILGDQQIKPFHTYTEVSLCLSLSWRPWARQMILEKRKHWGYYSADSDFDSGYGQCTHDWY